MIGQDYCREPRLKFHFQPSFQKRAPFALRERRHTFANLSEGEDAQMQRHPSAAPNQLSTRGSGWNSESLFLSPLTVKRSCYMEGKETRFGIAASSLFASVTTGTSTGAVNSMHDSMTPLGGFVPLFLIQLGELAPGGVGTGLYTILIFAILGVFIAGLMIGRTPEYIGKKIEANEMKLASIFILTTPFLVLIGTAVAVTAAAGKVGVANPGPHGFTEILYAFSSAANNNGSAFGGLSANTVFYNVATGLAMWFGRFWPIVAALAIAGSLAAKKRVPVTEGTMPTHGPLFVALLIGSILLIGVLTYVPALALGPVVEHFMLTAAR